MAKNPKIHTKTKRQNKKNNINRQQKLKAARSEGKLKSYRDANSNANCGTRAGCQVKRKLQRVCKDVKSDQIEKGMPIHQVNCSRRAEVSSQM